MWLAMNINMCMCLKKSVFRAVGYSVCWLSEISLIVWAYYRTRLGATGEILLENNYIHHGALWVNLASIKNSAAAAAHCAVVTCHGGTASPWKVSLTRTSVIFVKTNTWKLTQTSKKKCPCPIFTLTHWIHLWIVCILMLWSSLENSVLSVWIETNQFRV